MQNYAKWIQTALPFVLKLKVFIKKSHDVEERFDTSNNEINRSLPK